MLRVLWGDGDIPGVLLVFGGDTWRGTHISVVEQYEWIVWMRCSKDSDTHVDEVATSLVSNTMMMPRGIRCEFGTYMAVERRC
jgi:hypothetical protein